MSLGASIAFLAEERGVVVTAEAVSIYLAIDQER